VKAGAVLYAKDMGRMSAFYALALGLTKSGEDEEHVHLAAESLDLVVRQIPRDLATAIRIASPPVRREDTPVKLVFYAPDLTCVREAIAAYGGALDDSSKPWSFDGCEVRDAIDPEGNVIQFRTPLER